MYYKIMKDFRETGMDPDNGKTEKKLRQTAQRRNSW